MLLTKLIKVKINKGNIPYYKSNFNEFENIKIGDEIDIDVRYISFKNKSKVKVKCDVCGKEREILYSTYMESTNKGKDIYSCKGKCSNIKREKTNMERYGIKNCFQDINKVKQGMIRNHGVEYNMKLEKCLIDRKETYIKNWGVDNPKKNNIIKIKSNNTRFNTFKLKYNNLNILSKENNNYIIKCDEGHDYIINENLFQNRIYADITLCTKCNPINSLNKSDRENQIIKFIKNNYKDKIITNIRNIIKPYELDIYIPDLKLAFEFNGVYWHNELYKENNYHLNKTELCEKYGIQLIHIYEDDWLYKQDIVKSMVLNKLGKTPNKIYARKTEIKEITDNKLVRDFLDKNHIQGFVGSKVKLGLFYENELVSLMTFGKRRVAMGKKTSEEGEYELLRFCSKLNTNVVGGGNKLFKYFVKNYDPKMITTYADRSWSQGNLYKQLGFKYEGKTEPNYYYIIDDIRHHRFNFRKDKLIRDGYDPELTEHQIMLNRKIYRIFDSGNLKFKY